MRTSSDASKDVADLAIGKVHSGTRGFLTLLHLEESSPESKNEDKQQILWDKTLEWAKIPWDDASH